jgi:type I restriction enzyme M protein
MQVTGFGDKVAFIWSVADILRGDFKAHEFGQVILPFTVLRRLECALKPTKADVVARAEALVGRVANVDPILRSTSRRRRAGLHRQRRQG